MKRLKRRSNAYWKIKNATKERWAKIEGIACTIFTVLLLFVATCPDIRSMGKLFGLMGVVLIVAIIASKRS